MDIGGALAAARSEAGLTVDQVSERTRIRATIIRAIERDDYSACGGDYYARGHIRAIARVVGADPVPLITEYDQAHLPPPAPPAGSGEVNGAGTGDAIAATNGSSPGWVRPGGITAAEAFRPAMPLRIEGARRLPVRALLIGALVVAVIIILAVALTSPGSAPASHRSPAGRTGTHHSAAPAPARSSAAASPAPSPALLSAASAEAFGPAGPSQGDNPQGAPLAIDGNGSTAWHTDWYALANLNGQHGTGLLLDMGKNVTVSSVQVLLGQPAGGTVELRAGNSPALADLPVVAQTANPGGTLILRAGAPVSARYVLLWFTLLPPDGSGTFQAFVYNVSVSGTA